MGEGGRNSIRCSVEHYETGDIDVQVSKVECSHFTERVARDEDQSRPREDARHFPTLVTAGVGCQRGVGVLMAGQDTHMHCQKWIPNETEKRKAHMTGATLLGA